ncbi:DNA repair protein XRCC2 homolog isoform X2 [Corylus avellana]|uniref:DNA repair protein XRCC2 homolog isoform X2 n=1 Tax=Corylus avellana TaxID=13451 RepID=UPI00286BE813|nr:DNA repair protein XRCC2 homolog isoform X2 [Corylus avellana]
MEQVVGSPKGWIDGDESAKEMLARVLTARPFLLLPPLHRVPLRVGNVVELVGPSPSSKTHVLIQAAVSCVLPKEWNGVHYGGSDHLVVFLDLDCRFDILRFSEMLKHRIIGESIGSMKIDSEKMDFDLWNNDKKRRPAYDEELYVLCMRRFLYARCYDSFEFLATLKTLHYRIQKEEEAHGTSVHMLMIDSIGAFHWIDRASTFMPVGGNNRKSHSLQTVSETVVQEIRKLLVLHPMLVIATKATILGDIYAMNDAKWNLRKPDTSNCRSGRITSQQLPYREYMPSIWQTFVTHRILLRASDDHLPVSNDQNHSLYFSEWLLPSLSFIDKFIVKEVFCFGTCRLASSLFHEVRRDLWCSLASHFLIFPIMPGLW